MDSGPSCCSTSAVNGITVSRPDEISTRTIFPWFVITPLLQKQSDPLASQHGISNEQATRDLILAPQPTKEFVKIEEIAAMALYLASEAAAQVNGAMFSIDGGWTAR